MTTDPKFKVDEIPDDLRKDAEAEHNQDKEDVLMKTILDQASQQLKKEDMASFTKMVKDMGGASAFKKDQGQCDMLESIVAGLIAIVVGMGIGKNVHHTTITKAIIKGAALNVGIIAPSNPNNEKRCIEGSSILGALFSQEIFDIMSSTGDNRQKNANQLTYDLKNSTENMNLFKDGSYEMNVSQDNAPETRH